MRDEERASHRRVETRRDPNVTACAARLDHGESAQRRDERIVLGARRAVRPVLSDALAAPKLRDDRGSIHFDLFSFARSFAFARLSRSIVRA